MPDISSVRDGICDLNRKDAFNKIIDAALDVQNVIDVVCRRIYQDIAT